MAFLTSSHPIIGVTGPDRGGFPAWFFTALAVRRSGGRPVRIRPGKPRPNLKLEGLVIGGGADVSPEHYSPEEKEIARQVGEEKKRLRFSDLFLIPFILIVRRIFGLKHAPGPDPARDGLELPLITESIAAGIPLLGICRGAQLLNVVQGGSLHEDVTGFYTETPYIRSVLPRKSVTVIRNTRLHGILGSATCRVNALHRQAVKNLGADLLVSAREHNGIIQAIEHRYLPFVIGVQWHPEYLPQHGRQRNLFGALVEAAQKARQQKR